MANFCDTIEYLNIVEPSKEINSTFETTLIARFNFDHTPNIDEFKLFRNFSCYGYNYESNLVYSIDNNEIMKIYVTDIILSCVSDDGSFIGVVTRSNFLTLMYTGTNRFVFKTKLKLEKKEEIKGMKIVNLNADKSEIWVFLNNTALIIGIFDLSDKVSFGCQKSTRRIQLPSDGSDLISVSYLTGCSESNQFLVALLFAHSLFVMEVNCSQENGSVISNCIEIILADLLIKIDEKVSKPRVFFSSDHVNLFIIDSENQLWIFNYLTGCLCGKLTADDEQCFYMENCVSGATESACNDMIVLLIESMDSKVSPRLDLISFPRLNKIESFSISKKSVIFPNCRAGDPILIISCPSDQPELRSISRLDPNLKLQEIISSGDYVRARKFAAIFNLDQEIVSIEELKHLVFVWNTNEASLSSEEQLAVLDCVKEIKIYFNREIFSQLSLITMSSMPHEELLLNTLMEQTKKHCTTDNGKLFYNMICHEVARFNIFKLVITARDYSSARWNEFRNLDHETVFFKTISTGNVSVITGSWPLLREFVHDIYLTSNTKFCESLKELGVAMVNRRANIPEFVALFNWLASEVVVKQIEIGPEQLAYLTDAIAIIIRNMERSHDKKYQNACIDLLKKIITRLQSIYFEAESPVMKAHVMAARIASGLEHINPIRSLISLNKNLEQLERLVKNFNLDLNLDVLKNETGMSLAIRILDQTTSADLTSGLIWDKLNNFLKEFEIRENEFYYNYIFQKLISRVSCKSENKVNDSSGEYLMIFNRFALLLDKLEDKQTQLECLVAFASKVDVPFQEQLSSLIQNKISGNCHNNPVIKNLKELLRNSITAPILKRYGIVYNVNILPKDLLVPILQCQSEGSNPQSVADLECIVKQYDISEMVLLRQKCFVFINEVFYNEESIYENFQKLNYILNDVNLTMEIRNELLLLTFQRYLTLFNGIKEWNYDSFDFICEVGLSLASGFSDANTRTQWQNTFKTIRFCLELQDIDQNKSLSIYEIFGPEFSIFKIFMEDYKEKIIWQYFQHNFTKLLTSCKSGDVNCHLQLYEHIFQSIQTKKRFCLGLYKSKENFFKMIASLLVSVSKQFLTDLPHLCSYALYCGLRVIADFITPSAHVGCFSDCIKQIFLVSVQLDIPSNIFMIYQILETYTKLIGFFTINDIIFHLDKIKNAKYVLLFISNLVRSFAYLDKSESVKENKIFNLKFFEEKPKFPDSLDKLIPLIRSGLIVVSSLWDNSDEAFNTFKKECYSQLPTFLDNNLYLTGFIGGISVLAEMSDENSAQDLQTHFSKVETVFSNSWRSIIKSRIIDINQISALMLLCNPSYIQREIETMLRKCKKKKLLQSLYCIGLQVIMYYNDYHVTNRMQIFKTMKTEVNNKKWSIVLSEFNITLKIRNPEEAKITRSEMFRHPKMTNDMIMEFLKDYDMLDIAIYIEYFEGIFMCSFNECTSLNAYKVKVEGLINRAEIIWKEIIKYEDYVRNCVCVTSFIEKTSPYHYEILEYYYKKMYISDVNYKIEVDLIKLLYHLPRKSGIGTEEFEYCQALASKMNIPNPCDVKYLSSLRLPFHLLIIVNPMNIIEPELYSTNILIWTKVCEILRTRSAVCEEFVNKDILLKTSFQNQLNDFLQDQNLNNNDINKKHVFMGNLYKYSSFWFNSLVHNMQMGFEDLVINDGFIEIVKSFQSYLVIGEQIIEILNIALGWIVKKVESEFCVSRKMLLDWRSEIIVNLQSLKIEEILYKYNFYTKDYLEIISDHNGLLEQILRHERIGMENMSCKRLKDVMTIIVEIAKITNIDIEEFSCNIIKHRLKLITLSQESLTDSELEMSILNTSYEASIDESRMERPLFEYVDINELEILSLDHSIKSVIKMSLLQHLKENIVSLEQWNNIFQFLFRTFRPTEDEDVDRLCKSSSYALFLIFLDLHRLNLQKFIPLPSNNTDDYAIESTLRQFCLQDKTSVIKQLYYGNCPPMMSPGPDACSNKNFGVLKDIINTFSETIDFEDRKIKTICENI